MSRQKKNETPLHNWIERTNTDFPLHCLNGSAKCHAMRSLENSEEGEMSLRPESTVSKTGCDQEYPSEEERIHWRASISDYPSKH